MIGIVIVSHSKKLAEGLRDLAEQMSQIDVPVAVAAGINDPNNPIGTDATQVYAAIESVYHPDGVLVVMDMGSALLSAETALEFLSPEQKANVYLCSAPLVEGTLSAVIQTAVGSSIQEVLAEAKGALAAKREHFQHAEVHNPAAVSAKPPASTEGALELRLTIQNRLGLHARPAANFVRTANRYQAETWVHKGSKSANAKSINQVATLGVRQGEQIVLTANGPDAAQALSALEALADNLFGEAETPTPVMASVSVTRSEPESDAEGAFVGIPASPGIAIGPAFLYRPNLPEVAVRKTTEPAVEWASLQTALDQAQAEISVLQAQATTRLTESETSIFEAHQLFLEDPALLSQVRKLIFDQLFSAEAAWDQVIKSLADEYRAIDDEYMRERAADVLDVGQRVLRQLMGTTMPSLDLDQPAILVARDLAPSDTAQLDSTRVLGLCTELGGNMSHSAILARALGIPAVVGLNGALEDVAAGQIIALDGSKGRVWLHQTEKQRSDLENLRDAWLEAQNQAKQTAQQPAVTRDGKVVEIAANIGGVHDSQVALEFGAEGVGLFRTEFLFMGRAKPPTEDEQLDIYRQVARTLGDRPLIIRTLDVGGDKPISYLNFDTEANPFLGQRGIRYCLNHPELFKTQLRAILRASADHNVKVLFPMIGTLAEVRAARKLLTESQDELRAAGLAFDETLAVGIMIEVPAAVAMARQLAAEVDFFSIGTNDLTQYVMAADRGNSQVADLANALHPAVLRFIQQTVQAAHKAEIWVGLCGELGGNALATPVLVGLGLDELSMNAPDIPSVKAAIRQLTFEQAQRIAAEVLNLESAEAVQAYLSRMA